ncbi:MAG: glutamine-hydrolyzing carbamoyl-phosphate synthase small subunit [Spirochaetaceae bacterium]|nr:glutamine-hydrolyzing carbamoyl-phosphate synthase small subunit [Spirochaetaceae bacterium]
MDTKAYIVLANGQVFEGKSFGATGCVTGEVVFTTSMTGYLETLTDPSYHGQIVLQTFPLIGNYGVIPQDFESCKLHPAGYIVREWCTKPSNFRCQGNINQLLKEQGIIGIYDVDTRALTKIIRQQGTMNARLITFCGDKEKDAQATEELAPVLYTLTKNPGFVAHAGKIRLIEELAAYKLDNPSLATSKSADFVATSPLQVFQEALSYKAVPVTSEGKLATTFEQASWRGLGKKLVLWDFGSKANLWRELVKRGFEVETLSASSTCDEIVASDPDGVVISDGPGNPTENVAAIEEIRNLIESGIPIFAVGLGHLLLALAAGAKTEKLLYGHRGSSQPVREVATGKVYITSQNTGYTVVADTLPEGAEPAFYNCHDNTCEGINYKDFPGISVQFQPESAHAPLESRTIFDSFFDLIDAVKQLQNA